ncbi:ABC transporter substrate-binding protein [Actinacidiphila oryziradicis]|nr:extracellular solute-binding protein [Actinacidiphila oryziradicis]
MASRFSPAAAAVSRRGVLGGAAGLGTMALLAACGAGGKSAAAGARFTFWDMQWGGTDYAQNVGKLVGGWHPSDGASAKYQNIPWTNWYQTFTSAIAARKAPAVSSGASFQPFQFFQQGAIEPADGIVAKLKKSGTYDDFLPGTIDSLKYQGSYVAVPYHISINGLWYRPDLLAKAGTDVPTTWDEFRATCRALKKIGVFGYSIPGSPKETGYQEVLTWLVNNGGGWFNEQGKPECVTDRNIEAVEFLQSLVKDGYINPTNVSYTSVQSAQDFASGQLGMMMAGPNSDLQSFPNVKSAVMKPLTGPHGDKGALQWVDPLMMYKGASNVSDVEDFVVWLLDAIKPAFGDGTYNRLPARKSFQQVAGVKNSASSQVLLNDWVPIAKSIATRSPESFPALNSIEGAPVTATFTAQVVQAKLSPRAILQQLQDSYERLHYSK